jgi:hypothetical protein
MFALPAFIMSTQDYAPTTSTPTVFRLYFKNIWQRTMLVTNPDQTTTYYTVDVRNRKPHFTFHTSSGENFATASTHYGENLSFTIRGKDFKIPLITGIVDTEFRYDSPALNGKEVVWKTGGVLAVGEITCETRDGHKLGRFNQVGWYKESGVIEVADGADLPLNMIDELIVVGVAVSQHRVYQSAVVISTAAAVF